jgi:hypothetical protein
MPQPGIGDLSEAEDEQSLSRPKPRVVFHRSSDMLISGYRWATGQPDPARHGYRLAQPDRLRADKARGPSLLPRNGSIGLFRAVPCRQSRHIWRAVPAHYPVYM